MWNTDRTPYLKEVQETFTDPEFEKVVLMFGSQTGKSESCLNLIGYHIDMSPAPILVVQPTLGMAEQFAKDRIAPMIDSTPSLRKKIAPSRTRDSGNTMLSKAFPGGRLAIAGSNSPAGLASRSVKILIMDEVDRYEHSAGAEGSPIDLAIRRTATFANNRKIVLTSTPTIKGISRIEQEFDKSDQRYFYVPCHECKEFQVLNWSSVRWDESKPETARIECSHCKATWNNGQRLGALKKGKWIAHGESRGVAGFHLSGLYSPWTSIEQAVDDFLKAKDEPENLKTFVNTYLAESWEDQGEQIDDLGLYQRREVYDAEVPEGVIVLVAGVDTQDDRLECEVLGIGLKNESWSVDHSIFYGDPSGFQVWADLENHLKKLWLDSKKRPYRVAATCIDSGGHHTQSVYAFCKKNMKNRVFAIKGVGGFGKPFVGRPSKNNIGKINLFTVGVDSIKESIYARLKVEKPGASYCHFPDSYDEEYFKQLTAEKIIKRFHKGFVRREWVKTRARNETLDLRAYALAAYEILNIRDLSKIAKKDDSGKKESIPQQEAPSSKRINPVIRRPQKNRASWALDI